MGQFIKDLGAQQMVGSGFLSTFHAVNGDTGGNLANRIQQMHVSWNGVPSPLDYVTLHGYNNEWSGPGPGMFEDYTWAIDNGRPYVVGEFGINGAYQGGGCSQAAFAGGTWDGVSLPGAQSNRLGAVSAAVDHFFDLGADGLLQWGFMAGSTDNGEGDRCSGSTRLVGHLVRQRHRHPAVGPYRRTPAPEWNRSAPTPVSKARLPDPGASPLS